MRGYDRAQISRAVETALDNIDAEGFDDILGHPFEWWMLKDPVLRRRVQAEAVARIDPGKIEHLKLEAVDRVWVPKRVLNDHRTASRLHPMDAIVFNALAILMFDSIEAARPDVSKQRVFSYRKAFDGRLLWARHSDALAKFHEYVRYRRAAKDVTVVVKCDIATFYDRINLHRVQSALEDVGVPEAAHELLNKALITWADQNSYSLPIGGNGSRIIAEAVMIPVDQHLELHGVDFCRYVDDYRLFAPDAATAHRWVLLLAARLAGDGLSLNPSKTHVEPASSSEEEDERETRRETTQGTPSIEKLEFMHGPSGRARIVKRYVTPKDAARAEYAKMDIAKAIAAAREHAVLGTNELQGILKGIEVRREFIHLAVVVELLYSAPAFTQYFCDFLLRARDLVPHDVRARVATLVGAYLNDGKAAITEWIEARIAEVLGHSSYTNPQALYQRFRERQSMSGSFARVALLYGMYGKGLSLEQARWLKEQAKSETGSVKRAILAVVNERLMGGERKAWQRNRGQFHECDIFSEWLVADFDRASQALQGWRVDLAKHWDDGKLL